MAHQYTGKRRRNNEEISTFIALVIMKQCLDFEPAAMGSIVTID